jgi:hypothetical protein
VAKRLREGSFVVGMALVALVVCAGLVVMALSGQSSSTRSVQAELSLGRYATQIARSGLDECLADFPSMMNGRFAGRDMRAVLKAASVVGLVPASVFSADPKGWLFVPKRTSKLLADLRSPIHIAPVTVLPLRYSTIQNYGEIEFGCVAMFSIGEARQVLRRVTGRYYFQVAPDGRSFYVNPLACHTSVDRSW